jgi:short-subunit dehydrogenase
MTQLAGKNVLLTGGSRGIGPVIAEHLAQRGAHIALVARSAEGLAAVVESLKKYDVKTMAAAADVGQSAQRRALVATVLEKFGPIDILVNNAGLETEGAYLGLPWQDIQQTIEVNLVAPMELAHLLLPGMVERKSGHIVNISSIAGKCGAPYAATYDATKAGLAEWAQGLRLELANSGVSFSTIFPGYVTEVGMFARFHVTPPLLVGSCTPVQVARAVVDSIERNVADVVVNSMPQRWFYALKELFPSLGDWLLRKIGLVDFQRRKVGL